MKKRIFNGLTAIIMLLTTLVISPYDISIKANAATSSNWAWPTSNHSIQNDWPNYSSGSYHGGTDFPVSLNTPVYSSCDGEVVAVTTLINSNGNYYSYGKFIKIRATVNGETVYMRYCHLNSFAVSEGQRVRAGQLIAYSGSTGNSSGPHLHYEVRNANDTYNPNLNPRNYLPGSSFAFSTWSNPILPGAVDSSYNKNVSCTAPSKIYTYDEYGNRESNHYVDAGDPCTAIEAYTNGYWKINYPAGNSRRDAYMKLSEWNPFTKVNIKNPPTGYNISVSTTSMYDCEEVKVTFKGFGGAPTGYKVYVVKPNGETLSKDLGNRSSFGLWLNQVGTWKIYGEVYNNDGSFKGATDNGCMEVKVSRPNLGSKVDLGTGFTAYIVNTSSGNVLTNDGDNVSSKTKKSTSNQQWKFKKKSDGSYEIESVSASGKHLDAYSGKGRQGDNVQVYKASADETVQSWYVYSAGNGSYYLRPACSNSAVLDVCDASKESGANVEIWSYNQTDAQKFKIEKIGDPTLKLSTKTVNLDLNGTNSATVSITADGLLPTSYNFNCNRNTSVMSTSWGNWSGTTCPLTVKGIKTGTYTIEVSLIDKSTDKKVYIDSITVNITCSHSYGSWSTTKTATCNATGEKQRTCSKCGKVEKQTIAKTDHKYTTKIVAPTCTAQGYTLHTCSTCSTSYKDTYTSAKGHSFGSWTTVTAATCKAAGTEKHTCSVCGTSETRSIAKKSHNYTTKVVAPTTTAQGYTLHTCTVCGDNYKDNYTDKLKAVDPNAAQVVVDTRTASAGGTVTVAISLKNNPGISGLQMKMRYDSSVLTLQNATAKNLAVTFSEKLTANPYSILWYDGLKNVTTNGAIAEFTFKVNDKAKEGNYPITIEFDDDDISDVKDNNVHFAKVNGAVNVSSHIPGDVNGDGKANVKDLIRLQQHLNGWNVTVVAGSTDINGDGKVNVKDLIRLQQYLNGWNVVVN